MYDTVIVGGGAAGVSAAGDLRRTPGPGTARGQGHQRRLAGAVAAIAIDVDLLLRDVTAGQDPAVSPRPRRTSDREGDST